MRYKGKCGAGSAHANRFKNEPSMKRLSTSVMAVLETIRDRGTCRKDSITVTGAVGILKSVHTYFELHS